ncbi:Fused ISPsy20 transposase IstB/transcriptional regulator LysR family protein [Pseudomonas cannabina]|uniref:Fused ISPsy20 transposase IstB/transcriptional regulator LysR family protein n=2 Tax=Pseudomonas cannabina TaxID=86840 RepID=A0A0N8QWC4_PSECA|nr:Fused ISPsy20 transposase IstB/transcriptional regulator LysR family protein [Pseudomonas cannabina]
MFGGFEDKGVAAGNRHREHPQRNHRWEVERRDAGAHTNGLAQRVGIDAAGDVLGELAHLQRANRARVLDHLKAAKDIALGIGQRLALLGAQYRRNAPGVLADQRLQLEHDAHARADGRVTPGAIGRVGGSNGGVDFTGCGERHLRKHFLRGRVDDVLPFAALRVEPLAIDQQFDAGYRSSGAIQRGIHFSGSPFSKPRDPGQLPMDVRGLPTVLFLSWSGGVLWSIDVQTSNKNADKSRVNMQKNITSLSLLNWDDLKFFLEVARTRKVSSAAKRLAVDYTTVSRRINSLETSLGTLLFEKSRNNGFIMTAEGQHLLGYAESIESTLHMACEQVSGSSVALSGHIRMGCTEGFGSFFITPQLSHFLGSYPSISVDILPLPHFISLSKREADIVIALERPEHGPYVCCKLCDYSLRLYATQEYLDSHAPIQRKADLSEHVFISYVDDLAFSSELLYLSNLLPNAQAQLRSTSVIAQYTAALQGRALAILPCFLAAQDPRLLPVLEDEVNITRQFWMYCREDLRKLKRITLLWDYIREVTELNKGFLLGEGAALRFVG